MEVRNWRREFAEYLGSLPGHDPKYTNHDLIDALYQRLESPEPPLMSLVCARGSCVTTTMMEWALGRTTTRVLAVTSRPEHWHSKGFHACRWRSSLEGSSFRPEIILIDDPLSCDELRSVTMMAEFKERMSQLPCPAFFADQRAAKGGLPDRSNPPKSPKPPKIGFNALRIRDIGSRPLELEVQIPAAELPALCREHGRVFTLSDITRRKDNGSTVLTFSPGNGVEEVSDDQA